MLLTKNRTMIIPRTTLALPIVLALLVGSGWGMPSRKVAEESDGAVSTEDDYNPQCLPLDFFEKGDDAKESQATRAKRDETAAVEKVEEPDKIVAQPGYVVPARRRWPCLGRRKNFTAGCGPPQKAYRVKNFVMAKNPDYKPPGRMQRKLRVKPKVNR